MNTRTIQAALLGLLLSGPNITLALPDGASAAADPEDDRATDARPADAERHVYRRGNSVWFGKSKSTIVGYATIREKHSAVTTNRGGSGEVDGAKTRYRLTADISTTDAATAHVEAKIVEFEWTTETTGLFGILLEAKTGIDSSATHLLGSERLLTATIGTSFDPGAEWTLSLETVVDRENATFHRHGSLAGRERAIDIVDETDSPQGIWQSGIGIEFFEAGRWLGAIGSDDYVVYEFRKDLDPELKLVLAAAMEAIGFRLAWY